jgi:hypothetical protein
MKQLIALLLLAGSASCTSYELHGSTLPRRAAFDMSCPEANIRLDSLDDGAVQAFGCGRTTVYVFNPRGLWVAAPDVRDVAAADLACARDQLTVVPIDGVTTGVTGCNRKVTYARVGRLRWRVVSADPPFAAPPPSSSASPDQP